MVNEKKDFDYSQNEETVKNVIIPNSVYGAKWVKGHGWAVGLENLKLTRDYKTLEEALNQIGYGVEVDEDGEEILVKVGEVDYEMIHRVIKAMLIIEELKNTEVTNG